MNNKKQRMKELIPMLNEASKAYYQESKELMSNYEYDAYYDELRQLEEKTGIILSASPTQKPGYEVLSELPREMHESPMLSLDKTKERTELISFLGEQKGILSWKMDGLTIVLTYENGTLQKAVTRGNGEVGEVVTANARTFQNLPLKIPYEGRLVIRGEAVIKYSDFNHLNDMISEVDAKYKNPRNLCSGSVRQLDSQITAQRKVNLIVFGLITAEDVNFSNSHMAEFEWLLKQGFEVVEHYEEDAETITERVDYFAKRAAQNDIPSDGLVLLMDDIAYGETLGRTAKFPRNSIAFKWMDETADTTLRSIEWSASRTGLINPVAVFDPVQLEGTTVSRAGVHNLSVMEGLELGEGDRITIYKANMIIPQIADNQTRSHSIEIPKICPVCGHNTEIRRNAEVKSLYCTNPDCQAKKIKSFELFVSRDALNMEGLSIATMEKLIDRGFIKEFSDIFDLQVYKDEIVALEGFKEKSYQNMIDSIKKSQNTTLQRLIYALGIPGIGTANAKMLSRAFHNRFEQMRKASAEELMQVDGIGQVLANAWTEYFSDPQKIQIVDHLLDKLTIQAEETEDKQPLFGKIFVITGKTELFKNRNDLKAYIEKQGGKVTGTISGKTDYLINNDVTSNSSKNKKAKELEVPIISEEMLLEGGIEDADTSRE